MMFSKMYSKSDVTQLIEFLIDMVTHVVLLIIVMRPWLLAAELAPNT